MHLKSVTLLICFGLISFGLVGCDPETVGPNEGEFLSLYFFECGKPNIFFSALVCRESSSLSTHFSSSFLISFPWGSVIKILYLLWRSLLHRCSSFLYHSLFHYIVYFIIYNTFTECWLHENLWIFFTQIRFFRSRSESEHFPSNFQMRKRRTNCLISSL